MSDLLNKTDAASAEKDEQQYVTFLVGDETYGVPVLKVQEIIGMTDITHVPNSLEFMKGVINLRGTVVPVVDMRMKFEMNVRDYDNFTVIIIVEIHGKLIGMIVDTVSDVLDIATKDIQETPHFSAKIETDYIDSIGQKDDLLVIILDVDNILTSQELEELSETNKKR